MTLNSVPDVRAISYKDDQQQYGDAYDPLNNPLLTIYQTELITISDAFNVTTQLKSFDLKSAVPYKQYQTCFVESYVSPFEKVQASMNKTLNTQWPSQSQRESPLFIYY